MDKDDGLEVASEGPLEPSRVDGLIAQWQRLMETYPSDGWDGAAEQIAKHEARVIAHERNLDEESPGWHDRLDSPPSRRSTPQTAVRVRTNTTTHTVNLQTSGDAI